MGLCSSDNSLPEPTTDKESSQLSVGREVPLSQIPSIYDNNYISPFKDFPEWDERYTGYGIKRMKAYKCNLKVDELNKLRDKFWNSKVENRHQWQIIHQACVYDHIKAEEYLYTNNFSTVNGCINECLDKVTNKKYFVPNYCINEPYFELELLQEDQIHNEEIEINLLDVNNGKTETIKISESAKGKEIKERFTSLHNIDRLNNTIRLLFGGGIIKDNESLYQHKVKNGYGVQVCIVPNLV